MTKQMLKIRWHRDSNGGTVTLRSVREKTVCSPEEALSSTALMDDWTDCSHAARPTPVTVCYLYEAIEKVCKANQKTTRAEGANSHIPAQRICIAPTSNGSFQQESQVLRTSHHHFLVLGEHYESGNTPIYSSATKCLKDLSNLGYVRQNHGDHGCANSCRRRTT